MAASTHKCAVVRWLNDNNRVSVHEVKYFLNPQPTYTRGDEGLACFPGYPGKWEYRVLQLGGKKEMNAWLERNINSLMADVTDGDMLKDRHPSTVVASTSKVSDTKQQADQDMPEEQTEKDRNGKRRAEEQGKEPDRADQKKNGAGKKTTGPEKQKAVAGEQKQQTDAVLQRKVQKDLAESLLSRRSLEFNEPKDLHKDCVSRKEFLALKDDFRRLRRKVEAMMAPTLDSSSSKRHDTPKKSATPRKSLTPQKKSLTPARKPMTTPRKSSTPSKTTTPRKSPRTLSSSPNASVASPSTSELYNKHTEAELRDAIAHMDQLYPAVKRLLLMLFPEPYIISHSVSGKACSSKSAAKPPFDSRLYTMMVGILKAKYHPGTKEITDKVHSVQKWVQKKNK